MMGTPTIELTLDGAKYIPQWASLGFKNNIFPNE